MSDNQNPQHTAIWHDHPSILRDKIVRATVIVVGILISMLATGVMVLTESNPLAVMVKMAAPVAVVVAMIWPKIGLRILIIACAYLDLVKRVAYWIGHYAAANQGLFTLQVDILSFAPITLIGVFFGVLAKRVFKTKRLIEKNEAIVVVFIVIANLLIFWSSYKNDHDWSSALADAANNGAYLLLLFIVPALFSTSEEIRSLLRFTFIVFLPCALYGIWQGVFGYTPLDVAWLKSGITINEGLLQDVKPRAFGTLASPHPYSLLYWLSIIGCYLWYSAKRANWFFLFGAIIFGVGLFYGFVRSAWLSLIFTLIAIPFFRRRWTTLVFYCTACAVFALSVVFSQFALEHLGDFQTYLPVESETSEMAFHLGTYSERLVSFQNWSKDATLWTWFGRRGVDPGDQDREELVHDMVGQVLVRYGAVGLFGALFAAVTALISFHKRTLRLKNKGDRALAVTLLAMVSVNFFTSGMAGSNIQVFPWNCLIWLLISFLILLLRPRPESTEHLPRETGDNRISSSARFLKNRYPV
jgi:hypothetical protein